jgi:hypothetical protein
MDSRKLTNHGIIELINVSSIEDSDRIKFEQLRLMHQGGVLEI